MAKKQVMVTLDEDLVKKARDSNINLSGELNRFLREYLFPKKSDLPEDVLVLRCTKCGKVVDYGYYCRERQMFLCEECQSRWDMTKCPHDKNKTHMHIKVPGEGGRNRDYLDEVKSMLNKTEDKEG